MRQRFHSPARGIAGLAVSMAGLAALVSCSNILGLGDFHPADDAGGTGASGGAGGAGSQSGAGGSAGTDATGATAGSAGAGASGGSAGGGPECSPGITEDCYSGPTKTENVGICTGGRRVCGQDSRWGTCDGEVVPSVEDCGDATRDENCDKFECGIWGLTYSQGAGEPSFAVSRGAAGVVVGGNFSGGVQLPGGFASATDEYDAYLAALDGAGALEWLFPIPGNGSQSVSSIDVAADGEVLALVNSSAEVDYGDGARPPGTSLLRMTSQGAFIASFSLGLVLPAALSVVGEDVVIAGTFTTPIDIGTGVLNPVGADIVIARLRRDGSLGPSGWVHTFGAAGNDGAVAVETDPAGNVLVGGRIGSSGVSFGGGNLFHRGQLDAFLARFAANGDFSDAVTFGSADGDETITSLARDSAGSVYVSGTFSGVMTIGQEVLTPSGFDAFLVKYAWNGFSFSNSWAKGLPAFKKDYVGFSYPPIFVDPAGNVVLPGTAYGALNVGGAPINGTANGLPTVIKFGPTGDHLWHRSFGGAEGGFTTGLAQSPDGELVVVGTTNSPSLDIGTGSIAAGQGKSFVLKLGR